MTTINPADPFEGLDEEDVINHDDFTEPQMSAALDRVFGGGETGGVPASEAVLVGETGDGADIDMDTFEPVGDGAA
jgi:hypothetical protein